MRTDEPEYTLKNPVRDETRGTTKFHAPHISREIMTGLKKSDFAYIWIENAH